MQPESTDATRQSIVDTVAGMMHPKAPLPRTLLILICADQVARELGSPHGLSDSIDANGQPYQSKTLAGLLERYRKFRRNQKGSNDAA